FQPDILCIGGGISNEGEALLRPLKEYVDREANPMNVENKTVLCLAKLGNDAGIIGAALSGEQEA
ncbi:MAG TPA: glucokinase, partial [Ruminococcaceae bacterium]|nr:glucokinase [Oscillospiraceae bacterium]